MNGDNEGGSKESEQNEEESKTEKPMTHVATSSASCTFVYKRKSNDKKKGEVCGVVNCKLHKGVAADAPPLKRQWARHPPVVLSPDLSPNQNGQECNEEDRKALALWKSSRITRARWQLSD